MQNLSGGNAHLVRVLSGYVPVVQLPRVGRAVALEPVAAIAAFDFVVWEL